MPGRAGGQPSVQFIGDDAFDAAGQIRVTHLGGDTLVAFNTAGSGDAEAVIRLEGDVDLTADSFVL